MSDERRQHERFFEEDRVAVTVLSANQVPDLVNKTFFCGTADLSMSGLRLALYRNVPVGASLEMRVAFQNPLRAFRLEGRVVWVRKQEEARHPYQIGVEFTHIPLEVLEGWHGVVSTKLDGEPGTAEAAG